MKKTMFMIVAAVALTLGLQSSSKAQSGGSPVANTADPAFAISVEYAGTNGMQPAFRLQFENTSLKRPVMVIKDGAAEKMYTESLGNTSIVKKYQLGADIFSDSVTFELYDGGKKVYSKTFRISQVVEVKTDVKEAR